MAIYGYNLSQEGRQIMEARQQFSFQFPIISVEMPVPSQGHYGFHSCQVVDWFCLFI
jgi:hypothetical protein